MRRSSNVSEEGSRRSVEQYCLTLGELYKASERASRAPVSYTRRFVAQESTRSTFWRERSARTVAEAGTALAVPGHRAQSPLTASCRVRSRDMTERELPSQVRERSPKRRDRPRDGRQRRATWQHSHSCSTAAVTVKAKSRPAVGRCSAACPLSVFALSPVLLRDCCLSLFLFLLASPTSHKHGTRGQEMDGGNKARCPPVAHGGHTATRCGQAGSGTRRGFRTSRRTAACYTVCRGCSGAVAKTRH